MGQFPVGLCSFGLPRGTGQSSGVLSQQGLLLDTLYKAAGAGGGGALPAGASLEYTVTDQLLDPWELCSMHSALRLFHPSCHLCG